MEIINDEFEKVQKYLYNDLRKFDIEDKHLKKEWKNKLKDLINVKSLYKFLNEHETWQPIDIVKIYNTDEKRGGYSSYQHVKIVDDKGEYLYMKQSESEIKDIDHYCVWQTVGMLDDDYSGYLLFPLNDGKYFKVEYTC